MVEQPHRHGFRTARAFQARGAGHACAVEGEVGQADGNQECLPIEGSGLRPINQIVVRQIERHRPTGLAQAFDEGNDRGIESGGEEAVAFRVKAYLAALKINVAIDVEVCLAQAAALVNGDLEGDAEKFLDLPVGLGLRPNFFESFERCGVLRQTLDFGSNERNFLIADFWLNFWRFVFYPESKTWIGCGVSSRDCFGKDGADAGDLVLSGDGFRSRLQSPCDIIQRVCPSEARWGMYLLQLQKFRESSPCGADSDERSVFVAERQEYRNPRLESFVFGGLPGFLKSEDVPAVNRLSAFGSEADPKPSGFSNYFPGLRVAPAYPVKWAVGSFVEARHTCASVCLVCPAPSTEVRENSLFSTDVNICLGLQKIGHLLMVFRCIGTAMGYVGGVLFVCFRAFSGIFFWEIARGLDDRGVGIFLAGTSGGGRAV